MADSTDEKRLLVGLKGGSFRAFKRLYDMYSGKLYNFIVQLSSGNQYMAEEAVQATFIRIWGMHEKVDPASSFISFLCTIARNLLMNIYQRQTVEYAYDEYLMKSSVDRDSQTEENIDLRFLNEYIGSLAGELPAQRKKIFILSKRQNYTDKEITEVVGISKSMVATRLSLAMKFIREQLIKHYDKVITLLLAFFANEM